jgi:hypothetical protein
MYEGIIDSKSEIWQAESFNAPHIQMDFQEIG